MSALLTAQDKAPDVSTRPYTFTGETARVEAGGIDIGVVGCSQNHPKKGQARGFLTFEAGMTQQSCPLTAVSAAIGADVIAFADVLGILVKVGRLKESDVAAMAAKVADPQPA